MNIEKVLSAATSQNASDIHIQVGEPLVFRIHGQLKRSDGPVFDRDLVHSFLRGFVNNDGLVNKLRAYPRTPAVLSVL
jgi:twitching motility protein PilT